MSIFIVTMDTAIVVYIVGHWITKLDGCFRWAFTLLVLVATNNQVSTTRHSGVVLLHF